MSQVFLDYSKYYDALYKDKNYKEEVDFIVGLIRENHPNAKTILSLGSGTGNHDFLFADAGFQVTGVDLSQEMIKIAESKNKDGKCRFIHGDARLVEFNQKFDVIISLFHVISYQNTNSDVTEFLQTISRNLAPNGISIFDYWYGPAVLSVKPEKRFKKFESEDLLIQRYADTVVDYRTNIATVNYKVSITDKKTSNEIKLEEKHPMRYFFSPELDLFFEKTKFHQIHHAEWMKKTPPNEKSWAAYSIVAHEK